MTNNDFRSGLSTAIQNSLLHNKAQENKSQEYTKPEFTIKIANTLEEREKVFQLAYQIYLEKGYIKNDYREMLIQNYDMSKETVILMVQDNKKTLAGSLTLVFNEDGELPVEKIYKEEIKKLNIFPKKIVEISRLVVNHKHRNAPEVLRLLINYLMIYSYHVKNYTSLAIQVNPRHVLYYKSLLEFDEIGGVKLCPSVQNAPAVLLYLPLSRYQAEIHKYASNSKQIKKGRSMYQYFLNPAQEKLVAQYLKNQFKPMSAEEKIYFGFTDSGISRVVCV